VVDRLAHGAREKWFPNSEIRCELAAIEFAAQEVLLVKPQTYMNKSGEAVAALQRRLEFAPRELLIVLDDICLDFGRLRFRRKGSGGGHNGLSSVLKHVQTDEVERLRLGIGCPPFGENVIDYVLSPFELSEEREKLAALGMGAIEVYLREGIESAMNRFNTHLDNFIF
jgi:PTH1 family peptidyl-tRNA hydrolase